MSLFYNNTWHPHVYNKKSIHSTSHFIKDILASDLGFYNYHNYLSNHFLTFKIIQDN